LHFDEPYVAAEVVSVEDLLTGFIRAFGSRLHKAGALRIWCSDGNRRPHSATGGLFYDAKHLQNQRVLVGRRALRDVVCGKCGGAATGAAPPVTAFAAGASCTVSAGFAACGGAARAGVTGYFRPTDARRHAAAHDGDL
jgi:hypothetical protein